MDQSMKPATPLALCTLLLISLLLHKTLMYRDELEAALEGASMANKTDTDVLWLGNPFPRLTLNETIDLQISVDRFDGNQWSQTNPINTGFYMIKSNNKTIKLFDEGYGQRNNSTGKKEQDVLFELMQKGAFNRLRLRVRFLDTNYFSGFCQDSRDFNVVSTVHANCCRSTKAKVTDLMAVIHDWKRFKDPSRNKTMEDRWSIHVACQNSWI
ncbi:hypothetical protein L1987_75189 [Smallanthus sonchifolius]|uniref:Uncharacterized protein n=1 Tax=Smallanthus sonchifolius TaxID=185202 RepID=A0ACB9A4R6_9ASTR|nr:hypothetical protein L1987_75189 [Smallanthus sonchifolius]